MTTVDTFPAARPSRTLSVTPSLLAGALLLLLLGVPALMAPSDTGAVRDWHGNVATSTR